MHNEYLRHIISKLSALAVFVALQIPLALGIVHFSEQHDHADRCEVVSNVHLHEKKLDCDLYNVILDTAVEFAFAKAYSYILTLSTEKESHYVVPKYTNTSLTKSSRGPPSC